MLEKDINSFSGDEEEKEEEEEEGVKVSRTFEMFFFNSIRYPPFFRSISLTRLLVVVY